MAKGETKADTQKHRLQFDFEPEAFRCINNLMTETGAENRAEVVRYGLKLVQWVLDETRAGRKIMTKDKAGATKEISFPFLKRK